MREPMDCITDGAVRRVVLMKGAQVAYTEIINNCAGYFMDQDPCPILVIQPTIEMAEAWSKDRLAPMLRDTPALSGKVKDPRSRDSGNTLRQKVFPGGRLNIIGANAPAGLASRPIRVVLADEVDRYPVSAGTEGDPLSLASKRQLTFWNRKTIIGSTPTIKAASVVEREYEASDKRRLFCPCPHCDHPQVIRWEQVRWEKNDAGAHVPETAQYVCEECGAIWSEPERQAAIAAGTWKAEKPFAGTAGFHIPGLLSPWLTLEDIVREFLAAKDDPQLLQVWVNTVLGETWEESAEKVDGTALVNRGEAYDEETLPVAVQALTAGVDTQGDRLEVQIIGWGAREESWVVAYHVLHGDPAQGAVWKELDQVLLESYRREDGQALRVRSTCIDFGGNHGAHVLSFCRTRRARRVFAIKGVAGPKPIWPRRSSKTKTNDQIFVIGVDTAKDAIYGRLRIKEPGPGYIHFPSTDAFDQAYFDQLTSEKVMTRHREGRPYRVWVPVRQGARNEALDTFVYALAALKALPLRLDKLPAPERPAAAPAGPLSVPAPEEIDLHEPPPPPPAVVSRMKRRVVRSNYMSR